MYRNIDDCELKSLEYAMKHQQTAAKLTDTEYEQRKYDQKMVQILKELEQMEGAFFIPINAHPLKKVNEAPPVKEQEPPYGEGKGDTLSYSEQYDKQWAQYGKKEDSDYRGRDKYSRYSPARGKGFEGKAPSSKFNYRRDFKRKSRSRSQGSAGRRSIFKSSFGDSRRREMSPLKKAAPLASILKTQSAEAVP